MLFISFLCLLYLMVHNNGFIITKSISNNKKINEITDATIAAENYTNKRLNINPTKNLLQHNISSKISTAGNRYETTENLKHKSPRRRLGNLWKRLKAKCKRKHPNKLRHTTRREERTHHKTYPRQREQGKRKDEKKKEKERRHNQKQQSIEVVVKRDANMITTTPSHKSIRIKIPFQVLIQQKHGNNHNQPGSFTKLVETNREKTAMFAEMTHKIESLKKKYNFNTYNGIPFNYYAYELAPSKIVTKPLKLKLGEETEYFNTPEIEEILNDIKKKAKDRIAENDPFINNMITNSVTETTFEYDLLRNNMRSTISDALLQNIVAINDIHKVDRKRRMTKDSKETAINNSFFGYTEVTQVAERSVKEDLKTITHAVEDIMEQGLKKLIKKVKNKVCYYSNQYKSPKKATKTENTDKNIRTSLKSRLFEMTTPLPSTRKNRKNQTTLTLTATSTKKRSTIKPINSSSQWYTTTARSDRNNHTTISTKPSNEVLTYNDYMILTEYEELLRKSHQRNTPSELTVKNNQKRNPGLIKRNLDIPENYELKKEIYQDNSPFPDDFTTPEEVSISSMSKPIEDITYKMLSDQMSYNTYVNGYKYYLKFQKDLGNDKFSAMVKYQAHKHHKVDDIGKHILNKLPPIPSQYQYDQRRKKRFFDDTDIDDQDMSTKSDDSWFKRHFYIFIDNGPPKKFHSSQSVTLKSPEKDFLSSNKSKKSVYSYDKYAKLGIDNDDINDDTDTGQILENQSKNTNISKDTRYNHKTTTNQLNSSKDPSSDTFTKFSTKLPFHFVQKLFGSKLKITEKENRKITEQGPSSAKRTKKAVNKETNSESDIFNYDTEVIATPAKEACGKNLKKTSSQKIGQVDINLLVPKGTSVVTLREISSKRSKLQKFFKKFPFNGSKHKRSYAYRCSMFNPIQKLKDLFKSKLDKKYPYDQPEFSPLNDDNFQSNSIEKSLKELKSDKYSNTQSIKDIIMHVPDITTNTPLYRDHYTERFTKKTPVSFNLTTKDKKSTTDEVSFNKLRHRLYTTTIHSSGNYKTTESPSYTIAKDYTYTSTTDTTNVKESTGKYSIDSETSTSTDEIFNYLDYLFTRRSSLLNIGKLLTSSLDNSSGHYMVTKATKMLNNLHLPCNKCPSTRSPAKASQSVYNDMKNEPMVTGVVYNNKAFLKNKKNLLRGESNFDQYKTMDSITMPENSQSADNEFPTRHATRYIDRSISSPRDRNFVTRDWWLKIKEVNPLTRIPNKYETRQINNIPLHKVGLYLDSSNTTKAFDASWSPGDVFNLKGIKRDTEITPATGSSPAFLIDTALLSYDDDVSSVTRFNLKNIFSRSSLKFSQTNTRQSPMTKLNKQPQQTYRTPLPMEPKDFEKFLKEEGMDITSLTAPITVTNFLDTWRPSLHSHISTTTSSTTHIKTINPFLNLTVPNGIFKNKLFMNGKSEQPVALEYVGRNERSVENINTSSLPYFFGLNNLDKTTDSDVALKNLYKSDRPVDITIIDFSNTNTANDLTPSADLPSRIGEAFTTEGSDLFIETHEAEDYNGPSVHNKLLYKKVTNYRDQKSALPKGNNIIPKYGIMERSEELVRGIGSHPKFYNYASILNSAKSDTQPTDAMIDIGIPIEAAEMSVPYTSSNIVTLQNPKFHNVRNRNNDALNDHDDISHTTASCDLKRRKLFDIEPGIANMGNYELHDKVYDALSDIKSLIRNITQPDSYGNVGYTSPKSHDSSMIQNVINGLLNSSQSVGDVGYINAVLSNVEWLLKRDQSPSTRYLSTPMNSSSTGHSKLIYVKPVKKPFNYQMYLEYDSGKEPVVYVTPNSINTNYDTLNMKIKKMTSNSIHLNKKRDTNLENKFTAKDVAALEVILDVMKNTLSYDEKDVTNLNSNKFALKGSTKPPTANNSIQVHIAIPYNNQSERKRSPMEPVLVRKVFAVKMSKPVDLEYQVHSFEGSPENTTMTYPATEEGLSPGMYLLVDKLNNTYALQPVQTKIGYLHLKSRQATISSLFTLPTQKIEGKGMSNAILCRDSLTTMNKPEAKLTNNDQSRVRRKRLIHPKTPFHLKKSRGNAEDNVSMNLEQRFRKLRNWDKLKKIFGDDRACYCKCKPNEPMCRACAASDTVINELIFEFENIAQYMKEHCTELQTYFLMNPSGGLHLRNTVHNIDSSLHNYYKRVKGKCQGKTCNEFGTNLDKRQYKKNVRNINTAQKIIEEINSVADVLNMTANMSTRYDPKLVDVGRDMLQTINNCILLKLCEKRSDDLTTKKKLIKNVYSLDNISVNIICNPGSESLKTITTNVTPETHTTLSTSNPLELRNMSLDQFNWDEIIVKPKKRKGLKYLFPRKNKNKLFTYYAVNNMTFKPLLKRDTCNQNEIVSVSNDRHNFWNHYSKSKISHETQEVEPRKLQEAISNGIELFKSKFATQKKTKNKNTLILHDFINVTESTKLDKMRQSGTKKCLKINMTNSTNAPKASKTDNNIYEAITEYLTDDINRLFQLFGNMKDMESEMHSNISQSNTKTTSKSKMNKPNTVDNNLLLTMKNKNDNTVPNSNNKSPGQITTEAISRNLQRKSPSNFNTTILTSKSTINTPNYIMKTNMITKKYGTVKNIRAAANNTSTTSVTEKNKITTTPRIAKSHVITPKVSKNLNNEKLTDSTLITKSHTKKRTENISHTSRKPGFIDHMRSVKLRLLGNTKFEVTTKSERSYTDNSLKNRETTLVDETFSETSTDQIPTIIIINENDNELAASTILNKDSKNSENFKNLLLSIIQYETNKLNDEWQRVAYSDKRESDQLDSEDSLRSTQNDQTTPTDFYDQEIVVREAQQTDNNVDTLPHLNVPELPVSQHTNRDVKITKLSPGLLNNINDKINEHLYTKSMYQNQEKPRSSRIEKLTRIHKKKCKGSNVDTNTPEAIDSHKSKEMVCDLQATYHHAAQLRNKLDEKKFEAFVRDIPCYKYKRLPRSFFIADKSGRLKWDWIRNKRSLYRRVRNKGDEVKQAYYDYYDRKQHCDVFETYVRDEDGIYRIVTREKRKVDSSRSIVNLRNSNPILPTVNEFFLMLGDSITLNCLPHENPRSAYHPNQYMWETERVDMLEHKNVQVDGPSVLIRDARPINSGRYTCTVDDIVGRNMHVNVVTLPTIDLVSLQTYRLPRDCNYRDLKAIQRLGQEMSKEISCGNVCSIRIDEPLCQREKITNHSLIRSTVVLAVSPHRVRCGVQCRRDLHLSLVRLSASTLPALKRTKVTISSYGVNDTLTPCRGASKAIVTHSLRRKDSSDHHEYHKLSWTTDADKVNVVVNCDAGYYLLRDTNICVSCPVNTSSSRGENSCSPCPQGKSSAPGARECREKNKHHRRYDWWWYPPCGYLVASSIMLCACGVCICFSFLVQLVSRSTTLRTDAQTTDCPRPDVHCKGKERAVSSYYAHVDSGRRRPLSPSRVILARFFKPSLTSSRVTPVDSQETRFELWKEKNIPPPLPPIDFDTDAS